MMFKKFAEAIIVHVVVGVLVSGVTTMAGELPKSVSNIGNNELKVGYISDIKYSENPESMYFDECTDIITFNIDLVSKYVFDKSVCIILCNIYFYWSSII